MDNFVADIMNLSSFV